MTITNGYATLAEFKAWYMPDGVSDPARDSVIEGIIEDVSRVFDDICGRQFYGAAPASARYFTATSPLNCFIDDCTSITAVATDDGTRTFPYSWATTDYLAMPLGKTPITWLRVSPLGVFSFETQAMAVRVTAIWGYCLTANLPGPIRRACLIQSNRIYERRKAAFGITSVSELAPMQVIDIDKDVEQMLRPYIKQWAG